MTARVPSIPDLVALAGEAVSDPDESPTARLFARAVLALALERQGYQQMVAGLGETVARQSELLARRAEVVQSNPTPGGVDRVA